MKPELTDDELRVLTWLRLGGFAFRKDKKRRCGRWMIHDRDVDEIILKIYAIKEPDEQFTSRPMGDLWVFRKVA